MATSELDTKGLRCPIPVLRARKAMKPLAAGDIIRIEATDPSSVQDFRNFCETTGHELLSQQAILRDELITRCEHVGECTEHKAGERSGRMPRALLKRAYESASEAPECFLDPTEHAP